MAKGYDQADDRVTSLLAQAVEKWHGELGEVEARIEVLMVWPPTNRDGTISSPAIKHNGHEAAGMIRLATPRERVIAGYDAVISLDAHRWDGLNEKQRLALLDHELEHLRVMRDKHNQPQTHDDGRPRLGTRPDDWALTGFQSVVRRHGMNALEVMAIKRLHDTCQMLFDFATDTGASATTADEEA